MTLDVAPRTRRVAAAQFSGGLLNLERAVERTLDALEEAGRLGAELVVLPECFIGGYPYWRGHVPVSFETELGARLYQHAIAIGDDAFSTIESAVRSGSVSLVVGANEKDLRPGAATMYNSVLVFAAGEGYVGRHRKLVPTHTERAYWAAGDSSDIRVFDLGVGRVGTLICYEHHMLFTQAALALLGETIHCALWPGYWRTLSHIADKQPGPADEAAEIDAVVRAYAMRSQSFVISSNAYQSAGDVPADIREYLGYNLARGGSSVVDPSGRYLAGPVFDSEQLVVADIGDESRLQTKSYIDTVGHYARFDVFTLHVGGQQLTDADREPRADHSPALAAAPEPSAASDGQNTHPVGNERSETAMAEELDEDQVAMTDTQ